ncbi:MAG: class I SAM-dependent methyltransferase [Ilumatobacteraceae bacterium]
MQCPLCAADDGTRPHLTVGDHTYAACNACGAVRLQPFPTPVAAAELYGDDYFNAAAHGGYADYAADAAIHRRNGRARMRKLSPPPTPGAVLVDVGCAYGFTLLEARAAGWTGMGVDLNAAARAATEAAGFCTAPTLAELGLAPGSVSAITFFQVLEHLPDPLGALREAAGLLAPGGQVLIETWDRHSLIARVMKARWQQATPPSVLWLFDEADVRRMCDEAGLQLQRWRRSAKWVSVGLVAGQMATRGSRAGRRIGTRLQKVALPYALGDLVTAGARKP